VATLATVVGKSQHDACVYIYDDDGGGGYVQFTDVHLVQLRGGYTCPGRVAVRLLQVIGMTAYRITTKYARRPRQ